MDLSITTGKQSTTGCSSETSNITTITSSGDIGGATNPMPYYRIRRMRPEDVPQVLEIWAENDLHEGLDTIQSFMSVDPNGFVVAVEVDAATDCGDDADDEEEEEEEKCKKNRNPFVAEYTGKKPKESEEPTKELNEIFAKVRLNKSKTKDREVVAAVGTTSKRTEKRILGMCAGVFVHPSIAFIGLYGVRPALHGRGIGLSMWRRVMDHVGDRNAALYAVVQHLRMYRDRAGFRHPDDRLLFIYGDNEEHHDHHQSETKESEETDTKVSTSSSSSSSCSPSVKMDLLVDSIRGIEICPIVEQLIARVVRFDAKVHGYSRETLLPKVFQEKGSVSLVALDIEEEDPQEDSIGTVQGYGCIRTNNIGKAMLGPLYATNDAVAELLMGRLFNALPDAFSRGLLYMTLDSNPGGERIAEKLGLIKHEELPRFFRHEPYREPVQWNMVYCIHSPNFSLL